MKAKISKHVLEQLYIKQGMGLEAIAVHLGWNCGTIRRRMIQFGIPRRRLGGRYNGLRIPLKICEICGQQYKPLTFERAKKSRVCSKRCFGILRKTDPKLRQAAINNLPKDCAGEKNGNWKGDAIASICPHCGVQFRRPRQSKKQRKFCGHSCRSSYYSKLGTSCCGKTGPDSPGWRGGISKEPYPFNFDKGLKEWIRFRDNRACQFCGLMQAEHLKQYGMKLHCHHIDYDKANIAPKNLISLCCCCHSKTHTRRPYWQSFFRAKIKQIYS